MTLKMAEASPDLKLLDHEKLHRVEHHNVDPVKKIKIGVSGIEALFLLAGGVSEEYQIGTRGPVMAAQAAEKGETDQGQYNALFGRDSLRVAIDLVYQYPQLAHTTIVDLAKLQGVRYDKSSEEEPGRIIHESRDMSDPIAARLTEERGWGWPYYGSVDATPEFIRTIAAYCFRSKNTRETGAGLMLESYQDRAGMERTIRDALDGAIGWIEKKLTSNKEGLLEYKSTTPKGIENQVWKDSWDSYHHSNGTIANHKQGIASVEVQAVTHEALLDAADIYESFLGDNARAWSLRNRAAELAKTIHKVFWTEDKGGYFVLGTDRDDEGNLRQLKVRTSNMGHLFNTRLFENDDPEEDAERKRRLKLVLKQLTSKEMLAPAGIRTLASDEVRYREGAYHNGSVWIWDTYHISKGARRYTHIEGFRKFADDLDQRILRDVEIIGGFPEYLRGGDDIAVNTRTVDVWDSQENKMNRLEQPPQKMQAWSVAAILSVEYLRERSEKLKQYLSLTPR